MKAHFDALGKPFFGNCRMQALQPLLIILLTAWCIPNLLVVPTDGITIAVHQPMEAACHLRGRPDGEVCHLLRVPVLQRVFNFCLMIESNMIKQQ